MNQVLYKAASAATMRPHSGIRPTIGRFWAAALMIAVLAIFIVAAAIGPNTSAAGDAAATHTLSNTTNGPRAIASETTPIGDQQEPPASVNPQASTDATLSALTVNTTSVIGFDADRISYEFGVASTITHATIEGTTTDSGATVAYSGTDASTDPGHQVALSAGRNAVTVTVTSQDTTTTKTYTVNVNQGVTHGFGWAADKDFDGLIAAENTQTQGIWSDGTTMWVVQSSNPDKLFAYNLSNGTRDSAKDYTSFATLNDSPSGIWGTATKFWISEITRGAQRIFAYDRATGTQLTGDTFLSLINAGNERPRGIWSDGTTMWVADLTHDKIYAYDMVGKGPVSSKEFNTLNEAGNNLPGDIWSDGTTMWVTDLADRKVYAYNMANKERYEDRDVNTLRAASNG